MLIVALAGSTARTDEVPQQTALYVPGELLVQFKPGTRQQDRAAALDQLDAASRRTFRSGAEHWILGQEVTVEEAIAALGENEDVLYAEPNMIGEFTTTEPDDDRFAEQWALAKIEAPDAWDLTTGSSDVIIAVMDSGIEGGYLELAPNMWFNDAEVNGDPNLDEDGNGYLNDTSGWDTSDGDNDPRPEINHGTQVAGIIGAHAKISGGFGVAGINWTTRIMNLRVGGPAGPTTSTLIEAIDYAVDNGAHIINYSGGIFCDPEFGCSQLFRNAIKAAAERDVLVISAAGNSGTNIDAPTFPGFVPASYDLDNIIAVAMSDPNDLAVNTDPGNASNYGAVSVDLAAPGIGVLTVGDPCLGVPSCPVDQAHDPNVVDPNFAYVLFGGTSAATPHVSGVAGLIKSLSPDIPYELIRLHILDPNNVDPVSSPDPNGFPFVTVTDGRVNAYKAVADYDANSPSAVSDLEASATGDYSLDLEWTSTGDDGTTGGATMYQVRYSTAPIDASNWLGATRAGGVPSPASGSGTAESMSLTGLARGKRYYIALKAFDEWGNSPLSNVATCRTEGGACYTSFCRAFGEVFQRCTFNSTYGDCGCCQYTCVHDETCTSADPCPAETCSSVCN